MHYPCSQALCRQSFHNIHPLLHPATAFSFLPFNRIHQRPLLVPTHHILLHPAYRPKRHRPQHTQARRHQLEPKHQHRQYPKLTHVLHKFIDLVQIVLGLYQIAGRVEVFLLGEVEDCDEGGARGEEGDEPDAENLVDGNVED